MRFAKYVVRGRVFTGLGEGRKYVAIYAEPLRRLLGCTPYLGTLNIELDSESRKVIEELARASTLVIEPPRPGLGKVLAWRCTVQGVPCLALAPEKSVYGLRVLEVVACTSLREVLRLKDGDWVEVEIVMSSGGTETL